MAKITALLADRPGVLAILFYGNLARDPDAVGLYDLYVLTESDRAYHGRGIAALANRLLPPNVYVVSDPGGRAAKVAVITLDSFAARMRRQSWDTTLWARFCQPSTLAFVRDVETRQRVIEAIILAHETATDWAVALAPPGSDAMDTWEGLFRATYSAELRVEGASRPRLLAMRGERIYRALLAARQNEANSRNPVAAKRSWRQRRRVGKLLNGLRLLKACFTFQSPVGYALDKIARHSDGALTLSDWERRHPLLAAPQVLARFWRVRRHR